MSKVIKFGNSIEVVGAILCIIFLALDAGRLERAMFLYSNLPISMISVGTTILSTIIPLGILMFYIILMKHYPLLN